MAHCDETTNATVGYYDRHADDFAMDTASADVTTILDEFTALLPEGASVLDWGCGTGRDSKRLIERGFSVVSADASPAMCRKAKELFGIEPKCEGFDELGAEGEYDGIWACASLLHVGKGHLPLVLNRAHRALKHRGVLYASFKLGDFEGMRNGRWYTDLDEDSLAELLQPGFDVERMWMTDDVRPGRAGEKWLNCLSTKRS